MSIIKASCVDQTLRLTNTPVIASGGVGEDFVEFSFCPLWDGYIKTGVFYNNRGVFYSPLDENDTCVVPCQALEIPGNLFIAVFGYRDGVTRTSEVLQYQIVEGAITAVPDPDPDIYKQITQEIAELRAEWEGVKVDVQMEVSSIVLPVASWVKGGDYFTQTVTVEGTTTRSLITPLLSPEQWISMKEDGVASLQITNADGIFTACVTGAAPSADLVLQVSIMDAAQGRPANGITIAFGGGSSGDPEPAEHSHDDRYYTETEMDAKLADKAPAYTYGTTDLTAGSSALATGTLHFVYE